MLSDSIKNRMRLTLKNKPIKIEKKQYDVFEGGTFDNPMAFHRIGWVSAKTKDEAVKKAKNLLRHDYNKRFIVSCEDGLRITNDL